MRLIRPYLTLMTTPRSGSHWLSELLAYNGLAYIAEHLWNVRSKYSLGREARGFICSTLHYHVTNYSFHLKLNPLVHTFPPLMHAAKLMPEDLKFLAETGGPDCFYAPEKYQILLWRRDFFSQARSLASSLESGSWYTSANVTEAPRLEVDFFLNTYESLLDQYEILLDYHHRQAPSALVLNYEDLKLNTDKGLEKIFQLCNFPVPSGLNKQVPIKGHNYAFPLELMQELKAATSAHPSLLTRSKALEVRLDQITTQLA
jgi:hypothetical protein